MERDVILSRLLEKFEHSKHLTDPGASNRRVMLRIDRDELPEYQREKAVIRDQFNQAAKELERDGLVWLEWVPGQPVFSKVALNLNRVDAAYEQVGRVHPGRRAAEIYETIKKTLSGVNTPWIISWRDNVCDALRSSWKLPAACKKGDEFLHGLLKCMVCYADLAGRTVSVRSFSIMCFQNSKRFEREFQDDFIRIAEAYDEELAALCSEQDMSPREKLAFLGIYSHPELYQLSGRFLMTTESGVTNFSPLFPGGIAIPSVSVDSIVSFDLNDIEKITFIENKTNYEEYLSGEIKSTELVVYHGGFLSPKKELFFQKISGCCLPETDVAFWADIDLGGFEMFGRLQRVFPGLMPMRMGRDDVEQYAAMGLKRPDTYLEKLRNALETERYPIFQSTIEAILKYSVTIEQEVFIT